MESIFDTYCSADVKKLVVKDVLMNFLKEELEKAEQLSLKHRLFLPEVPEELEHDASIVLDEDLNVELTFTPKELKEFEYQLWDDIKRHLSGLLEICYLEPFAEHIYRNDHRDHPSWFEEEIDDLGRDYIEYYLKRLPQLDSGMYKELKLITLINREEREKKEKEDLFDEIIEKVKNSITKTSLHKASY